MPKHLCASSRAARKGTVGVVHALCGAPPATRRCRSCAQSCEQGAVDALGCSCVQTCGLQGRRYRNCSFVNKHEYEGPECLQAGGAPLAADRASLRVPNRLI
jgi:hypothetical protein